MFSASTSADGPSSKKMSAKSLQTINREKSQTDTTVKKMRAKIKSDKILKKVYELRRCRSKNNVEKKKLNTNKTSMLKASKHDKSDQTLSDSKAAELQMLQIFKEELIEKALAEINFLPKASKDACLQCVDQDLKCNYPIDTNASRSRMENVEELHPIDCCCIDCITISDEKPQSVITYDSEIMCKREETPCCSTDAHPENVLNVLSNKGEEIRKKKVSFSNVCPLATANLANEDYNLGLVTVIYKCDSYVSPMDLMNPEVLKTLMRDVQELAIDSKSNIIVPRTILKKTVLRKRSESVPVGHLADCCCIDCITDMPDNVEDV